MRIDWSEPAILDLEGIKEFIQRDSEYYALEFTSRIIEMIEKLSLELSNRFQTWEERFLKLMMRVSARLYFITIG